MAGGKRSLWQAWTGAWTGTPVEPRATGAVMASTCGIHAGRAARALGQATFNPLLRLAWRHCRTVPARASPCLCRLPVRFQGGPPGRTRRRTRRPCPALRWSSTPDRPDAGRLAREPLDPWRRLGGPECSTFRWSTRQGRSWQLSGAGVLPNLALSGPARTCQERLRRRLRRSLTLDRTRPARPPH